EFARAARRALECSLFGNVLAQKRSFASRSKLVQVTSQAKYDFFRIEYLSGVVRGAVFCAAAALDACVGLQRVDSRDVLAGMQSEIFIALERRNAAKSGTPQKHGQRTEPQM